METEEITQEVKNHQTVGMIEKMEKSSGIQSPKGPSKEGKGAKEECGPLRAVRSGVVGVKRKAEKLPENCSICFDPPSTKGVIPCDHVFCFACILKWSKTENSCPLCKKRFQYIKKYKPLEKDRDKDVAPEHVKIAERSQAQDYAPPHFSFFPDAHPSIYELMGISDPLLSPEVSDESDSDFEDAASIPMDREGSAFFDSWLQQREENGNPNFDHYFSSLIPPPPRYHRRRGLNPFPPHSRGLGLTGVSANQSAEDIHELRELVAFSRRVRRHQPGAVDARGLGPTSSSSRRGAPLASSLLGAVGSLEPGGGATGVGGGPSSGRAHSHSRAAPLVDRRHLHQAAVHGPPSPLCEAAPRCPHSAVLPPPLGASVGTPLHRQRVPYVGGRPPLPHPPTTSGAASLRPNAHPMSSSQTPHHCSHGLCPSPNTFPFPSMAPLDSYHHGLSQSAYLHLPYSPAPQLCSNTPSQDPQWISLDQVALDRPSMDEGSMDDGYERHQPHLVRDGSQTLSRTEMIASLSEIPFSNPDLLESIQQTLSGNRHLEYTSIPLRGPANMRAPGESLPRRTRPVPVIDEYDGFSIPELSYQQDVGFPEQDFLESPMSLRTWPQWNHRTRGRASTFEALRPSRPGEIGTSPENPISLSDDDTPTHRRHFPSSNEMRPASLKSEGGTKTDGEQEQEGDASQPEGMEGEDKPRDTDRKVAAEALVGSVSLAEGSSASGQSNASGNLPVSQPYMPDQPNIYRRAMRRRLRRHPLDRIHRRRTSRDSTRPMSRRSHWRPPYYPVAQNGRQDRGYALPRPVRANSTRNFLTDNSLFDDDDEDLRPPNGRPNEDRMEFDHLIDTALGQIHTYRNTHLRGYSPPPLPTFTPPPPTILPEDESSLSASVETAEERFTRFIGNDGRFRMPGLPPSRAPVGSSRRSSTSQAMSAREEGGNQGDSFAWSDCKGTFKEEEAGQKVHDEPPNPRSRRNLSQLSSEPNDLHLADQSDAEDDLKIASTSDSSDTSMKDSDAKEDTKMGVASEASTGDCDRKRSGSFSSAGSESSLEEAQPQTSKPNCASGRQAFLLEEPRAYQDMQDRPPLSALFVDQGGMDGGASSGRRRQRVSSSVRCLAPHRSHSHSHLRHHGMAVVPMVVATHSMPMVAPAYPVMPTTTGALLYERTPFYGLGVGTLPMPVPVAMGNPSFQVMGNTWADPPHHHSAAVTASAPPVGSSETARHRHSEQDEEESEVHGQAVSRLMTGNESRFPARIKLSQIQTLPEQEPRTPSPTLQAPEVYQHHPDEAPFFSLSQRQESPSRLSIQPLQPRGAKDAETNEHYVV